MSSAYEKTESMGRFMIEIEKVVPSDLNPNKMTTKAFDLLVKNIEEVGMTDPVYVRPMDDGKYKIVGGHHRYEAASFLGFPRIPVTVAPDGFSEEQAEFQMLRHNMIKGHLDPKKFVQIYQKYANKYPDDVLQDSFGFSEESEFKRMIQTTAKHLPDGIREKFVEAAKEIRTVDGLANLLNHLFSTYGDTLPFGFMIVEYGKQLSIWIPCSQVSLKIARKLGDWCLENNRTYDSVMHEMLDNFMSNEAYMNEILKRTDPVVLPEGFKGIPLSHELGS